MSVTVLDVDVLATELDEWRARARVVAEVLRDAGASTRSIAAALTSDGHPSPSGMRWHWRHVERLLQDTPYYPSA